MKKFISLILISASILTAFAGCSPEKVTQTPSVSASGSLSVYGNWLTTRLESDGRLTDDTEIILGSADTASSYGVDVSSLSDEGFIIRRNADSATLIFGKTSDGVDRGVRYYANYCSDEGDLSIVQDEGYRIGKITIAGADLSEYVIVNPEPDNRNMAFTAEELRTHLGNACGIYPEIVTESDGYAITLVCDKTGETYGDEAFNIKSHEKGVTITGGRYRGCMYAVYDLLRDIGWRFVSNTEKEYVEYLYESEHVDITSAFSRTEKPAVPHRSFWDGGDGAFERNTTNLKAK
ncbi:MAG: hypothetical protein IKU19_08635, partial [Clostridia bacterium]|nr:hypothetical protein [Clostridia bacterium]